MNKNINISVVVPVYGCISYIEELHMKVKNTLSKLTNNFEIIMVNDGSLDGAWNKIKELAKKNKDLKAINFSRNFGQHYAITAGLDNAKGEWVVVMDCDLQDKPEEIEKLYLKAKEGFDVVLAKRTNRQDNFYKKFFSKLFYKILSYLTDTKLDESIGNFGIYHKNVIKSIISMREQLRFFPVMVNWIGFEQISIEIEHNKRELDKSSYTFKKLLNLAIDVMLAFSDKPLRLTIKVGFYISFLAFIYAFYIFISVLLSDSYIVDGWASLIVSIWFLAGLIIMILGIIGIYLGKTFDETKKRPLYIIKEQIND
jgi:polyisoprenyl-phosphate glycosyltransferase